MQVDEPTAYQDQVGKRSLILAQNVGRSHPGPAALRMLRLLATIFRTPARWRAVALVTACLAATAGLVLLILRLTRWNADFFDVVEQKSWPGLAEQTWIFLGIVLGHMVLQASSSQAKRMLQIELREHLTRTMIESWMVDGRHYRVRTLAGVHDNEDGRIAEDARVVCEMVVDFLNSMVYALLQLSLFIGVLWLHSGPLTVSLGDAAELTIPGHMVFVALLYATLAATVAVAVGHPLVNATDRRQAAEASFREGLIRAIGDAQAIALSHAEVGARGRLTGYFARVRVAWGAQTKSFRNLIFISSGFGLLTAALPMLILAPRHFAGEMSLGTLMQVTIAFGQVTAALCWLPDNYPLIAQWEASAERVLALEEALDGAGADSEGAGRLRRVTRHEASLAFRDFSVVTGAGEALVTGFDAEIAPGERVLIEAPPAVATALFQAVAGLTVWGSGWIELPEDEVPFFMAERPYLPNATLARILADPQLPGELPPGAMERALIAVGSTRLVPLLERQAAWGNELGIDEQQRLGFARALIHKPSWIFLHDAASALDRSVEELLFGMLIEQLPRTAFVTITHRPVASHFYQRRIQLPAALPCDAALASAGPAR